MENIYATVKIPTIEDLLQSGREQHQIEIGRQLDKILEEQAEDRKQKIFAIGIVITIAIVAGWYILTN